MIKFYDGTIDARPVLDLFVSGSFCNAVVMNDDGSTEIVCYDNLDYGRECRIADPRIDASDNDIAVYKSYAKKERLGKNGFYAQIGDNVEVIKGRKYAKGTRFIVTGFSEYSPEGCYGHKKTYYLNFNGGRVNMNNVIIVE